jgi:hypothetical protein
VPPQYSREQLSVWRQLTSAEAGLQATGLTVRGLLMRPLLARSLAKPVGLGLEIVLGSGGASGRVAFEVR